MITHNPLLFVLLMILISVNLVKTPRTDVGSVLLCFLLLHYERMLMWELALVTSIGIGKAYEIGSDWSVCGHVVREL